MAAPPPGNGGVPCRHELPCDCGSPATLARTQYTQALTVLADHLRRQHLTNQGVTSPLPWRHLNRPEHTQWLDRARIHAEEGPSTT
jgi:hypothetical protein